MNSSTIDVPGTPVDPLYLDHLHMCLSSPQPDISSERANQLLSAFANEREDAYLYTVSIINSNCTLQSKFCALIALSRAVKSRWQLIDPPTQESIKTFLMELIYNDNTLEQIVAKCNSIVIDILNYEFPEIWGNFLDLILENASKNTKTCSKTLNLLSQLADFIDLSSESSVTSIRSQQMTNALQSAFNKICALIMGGMENKDDLELVKSAIIALGHFIQYFNSEQFVQSNIIAKLCSVFLTDSSLIVPVLTVLTESIAHLNLPVEMQSSIPMYFEIVINTLTQTIETYGDSLLNDEFFASSFISALTTFVVQYGHLSGNVTQKKDYTRALQYTYVITASSKQELFEDCVNFWVNICRKVYVSGSSQAIYQVYLPFVPLIRKLLIERMPAPYELEFFTDEFGVKHSIVKNNMGFLSFYATVHECLVFLTHLGYEDTLKTFSEYITVMLNESPNTEVEPIMRVCWAIGAVAGTFSDTIEDQILPDIIIGLFNICDRFTDRLIRTQIACAISFMCSQYYKFLQRFWVVMHAVFQKIVQFLKDCEPSYQGMIIESLMQLAIRCRAQFAIIHDQENITLLDEVVKNSSTIIQPLTCDSMVPMFDVFAIMIQGITAEDSRAAYFQNIISSLEEKWSQLTENLDPFAIQTNRQLTLVLQCHAAIPTHLSVTYFDYFRKWIPNLLQIFIIMAQASLKAPSNEIRGSIIEVNSAIINLFYRTTYLCSRTEMIENVIFEPALTIILDVFASAPHFLKLPNTMKLFNALFTRCTADILKHIPIIFTKLYQTGLTAIQEESDISDEFLTEFFTFVGTLCQYASAELMKLGDENLQIFINTLKWGCHHLQKNVSEISFNAFYTLFTSLERNVNPDLYHTFCDASVVSFFEFSFRTMSDVTYKFAFQSQVNLLRKIISLPESKDHAADFGQVLCQLFSNRNPNDLGHFLMSLFQTESSNNDFRIVLKNFLCTICQISRKDPDLISVEKEEMMNALREQFRNVPGYISPAEEVELEEDLSICATISANINELTIHSS